MCDNKMLEDLKALRDKIEEQLIDLDDQLFDLEDYDEEDFDDEMVIEHEYLIKRFNALVEQLEEIDNKISKLEGADKE